MGRLKLLILVAALLISAFAAGDDSGPYVDRPEPGEEFSHFFARITRGGTFQGIRLTAPKGFQDAFYPRIWRPTWEGKLDQFRRELQAKGVDLWGNWYKASAQIPVIAPNAAALSELAKAYNDSAAEDADCKSLCRSFPSLSSATWESFNAHERQAFTKAMVLRARLFGGERIVDFLAREYDGSAEEVLAHSKFMLLNSADFEKALRQIGWDGPIYFRGITAPAPGDPSSRWILMNDDLLRKMTPFDQPLIQSLEYVGILTHEMSHVFQDQTARPIDLTVKSAEGVLLIEGEAEYLAEDAMTAAARAQAYPSPLLLFVGEQGVEVVNRPGQETQGNLFPYTVGLPFAAALFDLSPTPEKRKALMQEIFRTIDDQEKLPEMLSKLFP